MKAKDDLRLTARKESAHRLAVQELREGRRQSGAGAHRNRKREADKRACRGKVAW
jgi:hypothetical protein